MFVWNVMDYRAAIRDAPAAGVIVESEDPFEMVRQNWSAAFRSDTWKRSVTSAHIKTGGDIFQIAPLLKRLSPKKLSVQSC